MTRTAILTITCPWCGGRVEGVTSTEAHQTIPCPYCRTELHVPRVGAPDRVVRERVIERIEVAPKPKEMTLGGAIALVLAILIGFVTLMVLRAQNDHEATTMIDEIHQKAEQRAACEAACPGSCPTAEKSIQQLTTGEDLYDGALFQRAMDRDMCVLDCEIRCLGIEPRRR